MIFDMGFVDFRGFSVKALIFSMILDLGFVGFDCLVINLGICFVFLNRFLCKSKVLCL